MREPTHAMILLHLLLCAAPLVVPRQDPGGPEPLAPFEDLGFEAASARAAASGRMLLVSMVSADSEDCRRLAEQTWSDDAVARWIEVETLAIEVEAAERADLVERFAVTALPTVLLLEADGLELDRLEGFFRPSRFVKSITGALELREVLPDLRRRLAATPEDPELYVSLGRVYADVERLAPAVEAFDNAWRIGRWVPSFQRLRTGQLVIDLGRLTHKYPPAKKVLMGWRNEASAGLEDLASPEALRGAEELVAIHRFLQDAPATVKLYERLKSEGQAPQAVLDALFDSQVVGTYYSQERYSDLAEGWGDVFQRTDKLFADLELWRQKKREGTLPPGEELMTVVLAGNLYSQTGMFVETLLHLEREPEARQLVDLVLLREAESAAYSGLMRAARKGGSAQLAREIADRGLEVLENRELAKFQELLGSSSRERER